MTMQTTNVVHTILPENVDMEAANVVMGRFGDIAHLGQVFGGNAVSEAVIAVTYFDVLAAECAIKAFGDAHCWPAPAVGDRTVRLTGSTELDAEVAPKISNVSMAAGEETYILEFYDLRDAEHYRSLYEEPPKQQHLLSTPAPTSTAAPSATTVTHTQPLGMPAPQIAAGSSSGVTIFKVLLTGLPAEMMSDIMMEAMLQQSGVDSAVINFNTRMGSMSGEAVVKLKDRNAAQKCARHFDGRRWGRAMSPVSARIVQETVQAHVDSRAAGKSGPARNKSAGAAALKGVSKDEALLMKMEAREDAERGADVFNEETFGSDAAAGWSFEQQVAANAKIELTGCGLPGSSDVSTDASESDGDDQLAWRSRVSA
jgi:hypothetical protein